MRDSSNFRNATRRDLRFTLDVMDCMTELNTGRLVDLSGTGLQIATPAPLIQDALYQWRFTLPAHGDQPQTDVDCGVHVLWVSSDPAGNYTAGGRFIQIPTAARDRIRAWCESEDRKLRG